MEASDGPAARSSRVLGEVSWPGSLRYLGVIVMIGLAVVSAMAAYGMSFGRTIPLSALGLWPPNGPAHARASTQMLAMAETVGKDDRRYEELRNTSVNLARRALEIEPTSVASLRNLAMVLSDKGERDQARLLMNSAAEMSRRDTTVNLWLSDDLAHQGKEDQSFRYFDAAIRTSSSASNTILPAMVAMLQRKGSAQSFATVLRTDPPWHDAFWTAVLSADGDIGEAFELRRILHRLKVPMAPDHDSLLIRRLASAGRYPDAFELLAIAAPGDHLAEGEILRGSDFDAPAVYSPIEWKVVTGPSSAGMIDENDGVLLISALEGASGIVAQQLVQISRGRYRLEVKYAGELQGEIPLQVRLACADMAGERTFNRAVPIPASGAYTLTFDATCRYGWFSIEFPAEKNRHAIDVEIDRIYLRRIR